MTCAPGGPCAAGDRQQRAAGPRPGAPERVPGRHALRALRALPRAQQECTSPPFTCLRLKTLHCRLEWHLQRFLLSYSAGVLVTERTRTSAGAPARAPRCRAASRGASHKPCETELSLYKQPCWCQQNFRVQEAVIQCSEPYITYGYLLRASARPLKRSCPCSIADYELLQAALLIFSQCVSPTLYTTPPAAHVCDVSKQQPNAVVWYFSYCGSGTARHRIVGLLLLQWRVGRMPLMKRAVSTVRVLLLQI